MALRSDGRAADELRPITIERDFLRHPLGSVLISCGNTRVVCAASVEDKVPSWMKAQKVPGIFADFIQVLTHIQQDILHTRYYFYRITTKIMLYNCKVQLVSP